MSGGAEFFEQFIDDFFSESEEHLAVMRRLLLGVEARLDSPLDPGAVQQLSRSLHTLKGLCGMVGLTSAEQVSHSMEDVVRELTRHPSRADQDCLELLFEGAAILEACIASRKAQQPPPTVDGFLERVLTAPKRTAAEPGRLQRFDFTPSAELAGRGIGVETARARLASIGSIVETTPRARAGGGVVFEFLVALGPGASPAESWRDEGFSWTATPPAVSSALVQVPAVASPPNHAFHASTSGNMVRVDLSRLDEVMRMVGELVTTRSRLADALDRVAVESPAAEEARETSALLERQLRAMREGVTRIRLVPIGEVFERMRFAMRDIVRETGKAIRLEFAGQDTEIDKLVVDRMLEPLLHLVRNSAVHGIESRDERIAAGKPAEGVIALTARAAGDRIVLEVQDDGAGMAVSKYSTRAREMGLLSAGATPTTDTLLEVICAPGFSTRATADMSSGRGVGMTVVRSTIRELGGDLMLDTLAGHGTRFTIELPLTLMITDALIVDVGGQAMAIPQLALREIVPLDGETVTRLENNEVLSYRSGVLPLVSLRQVFNLAPSEAPGRHVLVVGTASQPAGLVVDRVLGLREIVVNSLADPLVDVPGIAGATELSDGRIGLILDAPALVRRSRETLRHGRLAPPQAAAVPS